MIRIEEIQNLTLTEKSDKERIERKKNIVAGRKEIRVRTSGKNVSLSPKLLYSGIIFAR
jgi:hypothetical protein